MDRKKTKKILLVGDSEKLKTLKSRIESPHIFVILFQTAETCIHEIDSNNNVDLIICQLHMEGTDGKGLFQILRSKWDSGTSKRDYSQRLMLIAENYEDLRGIEPYGIDGDRFPQTESEWYELIQHITNELQKSDMYFTVYAIGKRVDDIYDRTEAIPEMKYMMEDMREILERCESFRKAKPGLCWMDSSTEIHTEEINVVSEVDTFLDKVKKSSLLQLVFALVTMCSVLIGIMWSGIHSDSPKTKQSTDSTIILPKK